MTSYRFIRTGYVKRADLASGKRSQATATTVATVDCTEAFPADQGSLGQLLQQNIIQTVYGVFEVYAKGEFDVVQGDVFELDEVVYQVKAAVYWPRSFQPFTHLTLQVNP